MMGIAATVLAAALWTGTAKVDVMIWEGGGEHPYVTDFALTYREGDRTPITDAAGAVVGYRVRLIPQHISFKAQHEVRGLLNCTGGGDETVTEGPEGELVLPAPGKSLTLAAASGTVAPRAGAYQIVLPRAVGAFACGTKKNPVDRRVGIGTGLFYTDVEVADNQVRAIESDGTRLGGAYTERHQRSYDGSSRHLVRYQFNVMWALRRVAAE
jgi:hypothetical protein